MPAERRPLWLAQADCLSHFAANSDEYGNYDPNDKFGRGNVMHLTCVGENGETVAVLVPGAHHKLVFRPLDPELTFDCFQRQGVWSDCKCLEFTMDKAVPFFSSGEAERFFVVKFAAKSAYHAKKVQGAVVDYFEERVEACEASYTPEARFVDERGIFFSKWFYMVDGKRQSSSSSITTEKNEYICTVENIQEAPELQEMPPPPLKVVSFDVETRNKVWDEKKIPKPENRNSSLYSVAITTHTVGTSSPEKAYYVLVKPPKAPPEFTEEFVLEHTKFTDVKIVANESQLVQRVNDIIKYESPLFITGHNIVNYDLPWILSRGTDKAKKWGRRKNHTITFRTMQRDSGGLGKNDTFVVDCQRIVVDLYPYMKENEKGLDDFKLDTIAKAILPQGGEGRKKVEIRYEDQFLMYTQSAKLADHLKLADYVLTDADLVPEILTTYSAFEKLIAASTVAETPLTKMLGGKSFGRAKA